MNLSEKIMMLRKKEGWSQEELANHLQISRQAVSKWESGQSMPDTDKIIQLSQLFHVTTDYLLLDQENEGNIQTGIYLSLTQVQEYLKIRKQSSLKIAFATFLCVISPIPLIGFTTLCQYQRFHMAENLAISIGLSFLIICITIAVILFCLCAFKVKKYDFLEKDLKYKGLLIDQVQVLRSFKNQEDILRRAQIVYKLKKRKSSYNYIKLATVDFELLERNCDEWNKVFIK